MDAEASKVPNWIAEAFHQAVEELQLFFSTAWRFTAHPTRFSAEWADGNARALNPAGFFATSLAITTTIQVLVSRLFGLTDDSSSFAVDLYHSALPYINYLLMAVVCHGILRRTGVRPPWRATAGITLFSGGSLPGLLCALAKPLNAYMAHVQALSKAAPADNSKAWAALLPHLAALVLGFAVAMGAVIWYYVTFVGALAGIYRTRFKWLVLAAVIATGIGVAVLMAAERYLGLPLQ